MLRAALLALLTAIALIAAAPAGARAATCDVPPYPDASGEWTSLKVAKVNCAEGKRVLDAFHACRTKTGASGRCVRKVRGYACSEQRTTTGGQISASATCKKGSRKVTFAFRQTV
jgi:hypothetical protein